MVTPSKPPPPYEQLLPLPTPCFKIFLERSLNDPHPPPPHFKHPSLLPSPHPPTLPPPPKNFDHAPLVQFICPLMMPDFSFHSHSKDKVPAFLLLKHKPIISFVCKIDCHRLFKRLKSILAIPSIHRHIYIVQFPLAILAFLVLRCQPVNLSCLSNLIE